MRCQICPRKCGVNRESIQGFCGASNEIKVARIGLHPWEEPCISGDKGSGTIFFTGCSLQCVFCQNYAVSQQGFGEYIGIETLVDKFIMLEEMGAHNINLVTAGHYLPQIIATITQARKVGLKIPIVYNSSGYETVDSLKKLDGLIDIYIPDLKYVSPTLSLKYSKAADYFSFASRAIIEMVRQCGPIILDQNGMASSGVIIRHLVLPGAVNDSIACLRWMKQIISNGVYISLMAQYLPLKEIVLPMELNRKLSQAEYDQVLAELFRLGLEDGYVQELDSATAEYIPKFDLTGVK